MDEKQDLMRRPMPRAQDSFPDSFDFGGHGYDAEAETDDEPRFGQYFRAVRKRALLIASIAIVVTLGAAIYMARQPDVYQARSRVQVNVETNPAIGESNGAVIINNPTGDPAYFNTQLLILSGPRLLQRVVKTLDLEHNPNFLNPRTTQNISTWRSIVRLLRPGQMKPENKKPSTKLPYNVSPATVDGQEDLMEAQRLAPYVSAIQNGLDVRPLESTRLILIFFRHPDPEIASQVVNAIADTYTVSNMEKKSETNSSAGAFIQKRLAELQDQIRRGEEKLIEYGKSNEILSLDPSQDTVVARLTSLNNQLLQSENQRKLAEAAYNTAVAPGVADVLAETSNPQGSFADGQLSALRIRRAQLLIEAGEEWPEVKEIDKQISELEKDVAERHSKSKTLVISRLETAYRQALATEQTIRAEYEKQRSKTILQNEAAINYRMIQQEIVTNKGLLDGLLRRSKENDVILAGTPNNISVLDYGIVPSEPVAPQRWQIIGFSFMFSFAFGVAIAVLLEHIDSSRPIRSALQVEKLLHLPTLASIPAAKSLVWKQKLQALRALPLLNGNGDRSPALLLDADMRSRLAESYGMLRTSLLLAASSAKTILVTSSLPGEGKTTTAINTAVMLARAGSNVLLIDADMRHPQLHSIFKIQNETGVSTMLCAESDDADLEGNIVLDETTGIHLLVSGPVPENPSELLTSNNLTALVARLERQFDYVIIDSPPIAYFTDGVLLSSVSKGVLLVVHAGTSSREIALETQRQLVGVGANIVGVILNSVTPARFEYNYYRRYYHRLSSTN
jgi:polysaccharide biosynthesis transport protein